MMNPHRRQTEHRTRRTTDPASGPTPPSEMSLQPGLTAGYDGDAFEVVTRVENDARDSYIEI